MAPFAEHKRYFLYIVSTASTSLLLHKLRSSLSILGIVCGVMTVLAVFAIGKGAEMETLGRIEQMGVKNIFVRSDNLTQAQKNRALKYHSLGLQLSDIDRLKIACPAIKQTAATRVRVVDLISFPENISPQVLETSSGYSRILGLSMNSGRFISNRDIVNQNRVCALGWSVSKALGAEGKPGQIIHIGGDLWKIVGVIQKQDILGSENTRISLQNVNDLIIIPLGTIVQTKNDGFTPLSELIIEIDSVDKMHLSTAVIKRTLEVAHHGVDDFETIVPFELLAQSRKIQQTFNIVFGSIGGFSLIIGGIGIMNIMLAGVSERVREIGLRRAVGARPYHIILQFLMESVILTTIGGVIGLGGGVVLSEVISLIAGWPIYYSLEILAIPLTSAVITGGLAGLYPAIKASKMDPRFALGYGV
jgi:putative ABC transport system permease protein